MIFLMLNPILQLSLTFISKKSPSKQIGRTLRKSFRCIPDKDKSNIPRFPEELEKPINLSHIVLVHIYILFVF